MSCLIDHLRGQIVGEDKYSVRVQFNEPGLSEIVDKNKIDRINIYVEDNSKGKTNLSDNEVVFRNFLWTDTIDDIEDKIDDIEEYYGFEYFSDDIGFNFSKTYMNIREETGLFNLAQKLRKCAHNSSVRPLKLYRVKMHSDSEQLFKRVVFSVSRYNDLIVSYYIEINKEYTDNILKYLRKKYGEEKFDNETGYIVKFGKKIKYEGYIKWTNGNVTLYFDKNRGKIKYLNANNAKLVVDDCYNNNELKNKKTKSISSGIF